MQFSININAPREKVWHTLWDDKTFRDWGNIIDEGQYMIGDIKEGNVLEFMSASGYGVKSKILKLVPNEFVSLRQVADTKDHGQDVREDEWTGGTESYELKEQGGVTSLTVNIDVPSGLQEIFKDRFPKALERIKILAEK